MLLLNNRLSKHRSIYNYMCQQVYNWIPLNNENNTCSNSNPTLLIKEVGHPAIHAWLCRLLNQSCLWPAVLLQIHPETKGKPDSNVDKASGGLLPSLPQTDLPVHVLSFTNWLIHLCRRDRARERRRHRDSPLTCFDILVSSVCYSAGMYLIRNWLSKFNMPFVATDYM